MFPSSTHPVVASKAEEHICGHHSWPGATCLLSLGIATSATAKAIKKEANKKKNHVAGGWRLVALPHRLHIKSTGDHHCRISQVCENYAYKEMIETSWHQSVSRAPFPREKCMLQESEELYGFRHLKLGFCTQPYHCQALVRVPGTSWRGPRTS